MMRTSVREVLALAIMLLRARKLRKEQRIGQILYNAANRQRMDCFYSENARLIDQLKKYIEADRDGKR